LPLKDFFLESSDGLDEELESVLSVDEPCGGLLSLVPLGLGL